MTVLNKVGHMYKFFPRLDTYLTIETYVSSHPDLWCVPRLANAILSLD